MYDMRPKGDDIRRHQLQEVERAADNFANQLAAVKKQRDDANRALDMERAAHRVTAARLEELQAMISEGAKPG